MSELHPEELENRTFYGHHQAVNRYIFRGDLRFTTAVHVGSGRGDFRTDALVVRDAGGNPLIPGSSLRGVLRSHVDRLLAGLHGINSSLPWSCGLYDPAPAGVCVGNTVDQAGEQAYQALLKLQERSGTTAVWQALPQQLCDACRLFGAGTFWASRVRFADLPLKEGGVAQIRHGVGIHRDTGTAAPAVKYDREVVDAGAVFAFEAVAENLDETDLALLSLGLQPLLNGDLALGGSTGRGLGACKLENAQALWAKLDDPQSLRRYLLQAGSAQRYISQPLEQFTAAILDGWLPSGEGG